MQNATFLHGSHDHSFFEELLEGLTPILPGGEKTVEFLGHLFTDLLQIYLLLLVILFVVFWLQSFVDTGRMQHRLAGLKSVWGYLLAFALALPMGLSVLKTFRSDAPTPAHTLREE